MACALAEVLGIERGEAALTEELLATYRKPRLAQIAIEVGAAVESARPRLLAMRVAEVSALILAAPGKKDWIAPELYFGTSPDLAQRLRAPGNARERASKTPTRSNRSSGKRT